MNDLLEVSLNDTRVGKLLLAAGDKIYFTFDESYLNYFDRPTLSRLGLKVKTIIRYQKTC